jgi:hypothetical protein
MNSKQESAIAHEVRKQLRALGITKSQEYTFPPTDKTQPTEKLPPEQPQSTPQTSTRREKPRRSLGLASLTRLGKEARAWKISTFAWTGLRWVGKPARLAWAAAVAFSTLVAFYPKIEISFIDIAATNNFKAYFAIHHDGPIPVYKVNYYCVIEEMETGGQLNIQGVKLLPSDPENIPSLNWGDKDLIICDLPISLKDRDNRLDYASIQVVVTFLPLNFKLLHRSRITRFTTLKLSDGKLTFVPRASYWGWGLQAERDRYSRMNQ